MKKLLNAIGALGLIGTPAFAADMAVQAGPVATHSHFTDWILRAGVNYQFH